MKLINYDQLIHQSLRAMIRQLLIHVQNKGLPGKHHFYISFVTPPIPMAQWLKNRYPKEMTILLQNQYEDLVVDKTDFSVSLHFDNRKERLTIPFQAITSFADPFASFSLRMVSAMQAQDGKASEDKSKDDKDDKESDNTRQGGTGQVVSLDAFRKKNDQA